MTTPAREPSPGPVAAPAGGPAEIAERVEREIAALDAELAEIDMLIQQARSEGERHETKRAATADRVAAWQNAGRGDPMELAELNAQLLTLTKRAMVMASQVDVLNGKQKALRRYRDRLASLAEEVLGLAGVARRPLLAAASSSSSSSDESVTPAVEPGAPLPPAISRMVLAAQEDLRRDIARAMHDGPAQSLTNIILQAQIVERLIARDPATAMPEVGHLIAMVQSTLEATKSFIFDVRPMVLDDLGLMPTLRRAARDRGRRAQIPVDFDSLGPDRRLPMELESGLFRMLEEGLAAYLSARPDRVTIRLDWSDQHLEAIVRAVRERPGGVTSEGTAAPDESPAPVEPPGRGGGRGRGKAPAAEAEMPAALAAMIEDRRGERAAAAAATIAPVALPAKSWRAIEARAVTLGARAELAADGSEVRLVVDLPPAG